MWCFLSIFCLWTLHSINMWSCLLSSAFAWGQARSKLGGSWYVHFASPFLYHNLLLFIDIFHIWIQYLCYFTYFACLMIFGVLITGARFQLEKDHQDTIFMKINNWRKTSQNSYFTIWRREPRGEAKVGLHGPTPCGGADLLLALTRSVETLHADSSKQNKTTFCSIHP